MQRIGYDNARARMPTASRAVAALALGGVAWACAEAALGLLPVSTVTKGYVPVLGLTGLLGGWYGLGRETLRTPYRTVLAGLRMALYLAAMTVVYLGALDMFRHAHMVKSTNVFGALLDGLSFGLRAAGELLSVDMLGMVIVGCVTAAILTWLTQRRWP
ncbi:MULTISPECIES: TrgA family protein [Thioclava]|uniref:TrgA family protein n=2 Tax=Thioclava TaxID=285107 RepID=A0ABZ1DXY3_9RHOB|nr:TrgA family protein [Thioclava sp. FTW29]